MKPTTIKLRDFLTDEGVTHESKDNGGSIGIAGATFPSSMIYAAFEEGVTRVRYITPGVGTISTPHPMLYLTMKRGGVFIEGREEETTQ